MASEKNSTFLQENTSRSDEIRLTPEEWNGVAEFLLGLSDLVEREILGETATHAERTQAIENLHRMMDLAAGAVLYVGCNAAQECVFSIRESNEEAYVVS